VARFRKPILDIETRREYPSMMAAGRELCELVGGKTSQRFVWYRIARRFPTRFLTKDRDGEWAPLDDPDVPKGRTNH
jgi:hypothetical protein